jgi:uncharacterized membrane protein HdeD (DUF308 family)
MPTHFRWLWYLVGLAGMALAIVGLVAMIGSILEEGLVLPVLAIAAIAAGILLARYRFRRRHGPHVQGPEWDPGGSDDAPRR